MGKIKEFFKYFIKEDPYEYSNYHNVDLSVDLDECKKMSREELLHFIEKEEYDKKMLLRDQESLQRATWNLSSEFNFFLLLFGITLAFPLFFYIRSFLCFFVYLFLGVVFAFILYLINDGLHSFLMWHQISERALISYHLLLALLYGSLLTLLCLLP